MEVQEVVRDIHGSNEHDFCKLEQSMAKEL